jgi:hypothetical protein
MRLQKPSSANLLVICFLEPQTAHIMAASLGTAGTASFGQTGVATTAAAMTIESSGKVEKKKKK